MERRIPAELQPMLQAYAGQLQTEFGELISGIYLYGSIAWGAYVPETSDVDFLVITSKRLDDSQLSRLQQLHLNLMKRYPEAKKLDGMYIQQTDLGKKNEQLGPYPYCQNGSLAKKRGYWDLNDVTWWTLRQKGITICGVEAQQLPLATDWRDVLATMRYNVETYWASKAKKQYLFLFDEWVEFAVTTLSRILYTVEHQSIIGKDQAVREMLDRLPEEWHPLLSEALRLRKDSTHSPLFSSRWKRAKRTAAFIQHISLCCQEEMNKE